MNQFAVLFANVLAFLEGAAPEIRERCSETTHQKLQAFINEVTVAKGLAETSLPTIAAPGLDGPDITDLMNRFIALLNDAETQNTQRLTVMAGLVQSMEKIAVLMFDTTTPAAG